jgi:Uma2 family endonuclease
MSQVLQKLDTSAFYEGDQPMVEHARQHFLIEYLESVIRWLYFKENWFVVGNLELDSEKITNPISPDIMFFKGVTLTEAEIDDLSLWRIELPQRPPPTVVFEIGSKSTGPTDIREKPEIYRVLGVKEYFAFDPKTYWGKKQPVRLKGWRYENEVATEIQPDQQGRLWSAELDSFIGREGSQLFLYDQTNKMRLTEKEGEKTQERDRIFNKLRAQGINPEDLGL